MSKKVLFFDIDGTILSDITRKIPMSAIKALEKARENGHLLFVNTGRTYCALPKDILEMAFHGFLCGCGTYLTYGDKVLFRSSISKERGVAILDKMEECYIDGVCEGLEDLYFPKAESRCEKLEIDRKRISQRGLGNQFYIEERNFIYDKIFIHIDEKSKKQDFFDFIAPDMDIIDRENSQYECTQKGLSKATACDMILKEFSSSIEDAYVFGDSSNDLTMFQFAKHTIAMGAHSPVLKPYTEFITKTVEDDGIEYAMKHFGLV